ncbi:phage tail protein [cf. Phormidesmis sp. LEGE 11477]|uniref:phage tail protein n=1 Tax=cf. Phormidesmis sp. LEGE 11477 TaxID=1828680 RepID=UPI001880A8C0|nr:phage tail protein [cf. Phormidesmis sp. LEGE 11477]MBE9063958.1 hypothetical protein [cf. Phormidesmis sp. LEGE 11477]
MADANGQRFWMISEPEQWTLANREDGSPSGVEYDRDRRRLRLASQRLRPLWPNRWNIEVILPGEEESERLRSQPFTFTAQAVSETEEDSDLLIAAVSPQALRASDEVTDLSLQVANLGDQQRATVTLGLPDGRYTTRSAVLSTEETEVETTNSTLTLRALLNQPGAWSLRLTLADGRQSPPYHFTVLNAVESADSLEITTLEGDTAPNSSGFQRLRFLGQGFQSGMSAFVTFPGGSREIASGDLQPVAEDSFELFIDLQATAISAARALLEQVPVVQDSFGTRARWDVISRRVVATGAIVREETEDALEQALEQSEESESTGEIGIYLPPTGYTPTDLTMGYDGILYVVLHAGDSPDRLVMVDLRDRWNPFSVPLPTNFIPWRLAPHIDGGVYALSRPNEENPERQLVRVQGEPLPRYAQQAYTPTTFRPCEENPNPPRSRQLWAGSFENEEMVAIASNEKGELALLSWVTNAAANLRLWNNSQNNFQSNTWHSPIALAGAQYPFSFKWLPHRRVALLLPGLTTESVVYALPPLNQLDQQNSDSTNSSPFMLRPAGSFYPLQDYTGGPFVNGITQPPTYPTNYPTVDSVKTLYPLSLRTFSPNGQASTRLIDSHNVQTVWHRLYLEAVIPAKTGIQVFLAATDTEAPPLAEDWFEHRFGQRFAPGVQAAGDPAYDRQIPLGAWVSQASEVPYHSGLLGCEIKQNQQGLFTALIQRSGRQVRSLQGRYLQIRVVLKGDGHKTPEIAAIRAYASRFSYLNQYLPTLYQESLFGSDADSEGTSTPADFLERFLDNFEGVLTPLEDRIAQADLLTDARTVPAEALDWLGSWVGVSFDSAYPVERRRKLLQATPQLQRRRGTLDGLKQAIDIGTGGSVSSGEIVVLEDFRLRRTFATILGANLADTTNPLTAGISVSGNSFIGDTLVLGDDQQREFLALFGANLRLAEEGDEEAIATFFDKLANRVTIYVHSDVEPQDLGLIRRIADLESPAHVYTRVVETTVPFLVSLSAQVGLDTYLRPERQRKVVTIGGESDQGGPGSYLGIHDVLQQTASLDPRLTGNFNADLRYPVARGEADGSPLVGDSFVLDASESEASAGRSISRYRWTWLDSS